jgi:serine/threonine protein kinase
MSDIAERISAALAGHYAVERELGHGGMATVHLARDTRHGRMVAIKVLRPELAQAVGGARFLREINIAAQLQSPHILPLLDSGEADGLLYYVMPYIEGDSLRGVLAKQGALHPRRRFDCCAMWWTGSPTRIARVWCIATSSRTT